MNKKWIVLTLLSGLYTGSVQAQQSRDVYLECMREVEKLSQSKVYKSIEMKELDLSKIESTQLEAVFSKIEKTENSAFNLNDKRITATVHYKSNHSIGLYISGEVMASPYCKALSSSFSLSSYSGTAFDLGTGNHHQEVKIRGGEGFNVSILVSPIYEERESNTKAQFVGKIIFADDEKHVIATQLMRKNR